MDKKFLYILMILILSLAKSNTVIGQKKESYFFNLAIDNDTVYANNVTSCHFHLKCCRWLPKQIIINRIAYPNHRALNNHAIYLLISHNEREYEDPLPPIWRFQNKKRWVSRWKSIKFKTELDLGYVFFRGFAKIKRRRFSKFAQHRLRRLYNSSSFGYQRK